MNKENYLKQMGITIWKERDQNSIDRTINKNQNWENLKERIASCRACGLEKTRTQTVFGVGNKEAELLLIGEAPGAQEDLKGEPFVGRAGELLNNILSAVGLKREAVYIANILKCRPPENRDPNPEEVRLCTPFLLEQIALIHPKLLVALGRIAAQFLLKTTLPLAKLRKTEFTYGPHSIPLIITFHPAYLLRSPLEKSKAWEDWLWIKEILSERDFKKNRED